MSTLLPRLRWSALVLAALLGAQRSASTQLANDIVIVRDEYGIPHIDAPTSVKAFHGLGYVTACDRLFQMEFHRRSMRGELAAIFPQTTHPKALEFDIRARTIGFAHYADAMLAPGSGLDPQTRAILEAYAAGVNKRLAEHRRPLNPVPWPYMFQVLDAQHMADWTAADGILVWMYYSESTLGWADYFYDCATVNPNEKPDPGGAVLDKLYPNTFASLLRRLGFPFLAAAQLLDAPRSLDLAQRGTAPATGIKASHNLVVHGSVTDTGKPMLLAKPQHRVATPSTHYEFALKAGTEIDFRGAGFAGSPGVLHGWNRYLAWSISGMPGDSCDVYSIQFQDAAHTLYNVRELNGATTQHVVDPSLTETITVRIEGQVYTTVQVTHRRTIWGPLVTDRIEAELGPNHHLPLLKGVAMRSLLLDEAAAGRTSLTGSLGLMHAANRAAMIDATRKWLDPGAHMLVATKDEGEIGYRSLVGLPLRPQPPPCVPYGKEMLNGNLMLDDWQGKIGFGYMPAYLGSDREYLSTANNLAIDPALMVPPSQPYQLGLLGDTARSWRLREMTEERLAASAPITFAEMETFDKDMINPRLRTVVLLARAIQSDGAIVNSDALALLASIAPWGEPPSGTSNWNMDHDEHSAYYRALLSVSANLIGFTGFPELEEEYGARDAGVTKMLREISGDEQGFYDMVDSVLKAQLEGWMNGVLGYAWRHKLEHRHEAESFALIHQWNLKPLDPDGLPNPDPANDSNWLDANETVLGLRAMDDGTIWSQKGEAYKFIANLADPDRNLSLIAPGVSDDKNDLVLYQNHLQRWIDGEMYPARLSWNLFTQTPVATLSYL